MPCNISSNLATSVCLQGQCAAKYLLTRALIFQKPSTQVNKLFREKTPIVCQEGRQKCQVSLNGEARLKLTPKNIFVGDFVYYRATELPSNRASCGECKLSLFREFFFVFPLDALSPSVSSATDLSGCYEPGMAAR